MLAEDTPKFFVTPIMINASAVMLVDQMYGSRFPVSISRNFHLNNKSMEAWSTCSEHVNLLAIGA